MEPLRGSRPAPPVGLSEDHLLPLLFIVVVLIGLSMMSTGDPPATPVEHGAFLLAPEEGPPAGEPRDTAAAAERTPEEGEPVESP